MKLYYWAMSQKLPVNKFKWMKDTSKFHEDVVKNYNEENDERFFSKLMFNILKNYLNFIMIYYFYEKE